MTVTLTKLDGRSITPKHLNWLDKLCKLDYFGITTPRILVLCSEGKLQAWGINSEEGIVVTEILNYAIGKELFIEGIVGKDIFKEQKAEAIFKELQRIASEFRCNAIGGLSQVKVYDKVYKHLGMWPIATRYVWRV